MSTYVVATSAGQEVSEGWHSVEAACAAARQKMEDDPEIGGLDVFLVDRNGNWTQERAVVFAPDANWETTITVLMPGERIQAPGPIPHRITEDDLDGYDLGDPKRVELQRVIDRGGWA